MITISPTVTPKTIGARTRKACSKLADASALVFVDVKPAPDALPNKCTFNVREAVAREGGVVRQKDLSRYLKMRQPVQLRWNSTTRISSADLPVLTFGWSKGRAILRIVLDRIPRLVT